MIQNQKFVNRALASMVGGCRQADRELRNGMNLFGRASESTFVYAIFSAFKNIPGQPVNITPGVIFSRHTSVLAIPAGMMDKNEAAAIVEKLLLDTALGPASIYFKYYLLQALVKAGFGNDYLSRPDKWRNATSNGKVSVRYLNKEKKWILTINLPQKTTGFFIRKGKTYRMK